MSVVVDASVLVAARVDSQREGPWARTAISQPQLAAPELAVAESTNILRRLELAGTVSRSEATAAHRDLLRLNLRLYPFAPFAARVWELRFNLTAYDAWYVTLAEALDWPLVTLDRRISRATGPRCDVVIPPAGI